MLRNGNGVDARLYGKELTDRQLRVGCGGTWMAYNDTDHRQGGIVWLVNHDSNVDTDDRIEEMINDHDDTCERIVLSGKAAATNIPPRAIPAELWITNPNGVVVYEVHGMEALSGDEAGVRHHSVGAVPEGAKTRVEVNRYERDRRARDECIQEHGATCKVCGLDFEKRYGKIGQGYIHVHHTKPLSEITDHDNHKIKPLEDLVPVCPNCHAMLHKGELQPFTVPQLQLQMTHAARGNRTE